MQRGIAILLSLSLSIIFGVEPSKNLETQLPNTNSSEITLDVEQVQQIRQIKKGVNEIFEKARKARGKSKQDKTQFNSSLKKAALPFKTNKEKSKKSFKESINIVNKKVTKPLKNSRFKRQKLEKQKLAEFKGRANARRVEMMSNENTANNQMRENQRKTVSRTNNRNSRDGGVEFGFQFIEDLYSEFGWVLETNGEGCDGCPGNLENMEVMDSFDIMEQTAFEDWASPYEFESFYFQFIDENETGEYDDGEIYAVSCEGGSVFSAHSTTDFVDPDNVNVQLSLSNTGWEGTGGSYNGDIYVGPHVSVQPDGFDTPDGDGYFVRNYTGQSSSKYAITKEGEGFGIQSEDRGNIEFTADWAANTDLGARFVAIVDGVWYASDQFGMGTDDHGNMNQTEVTEWEEGLSVNADSDNWYVSLAGPPNGYEWRDGVQWDPDPAVAEGGLPDGDITQFGIAWLHTGNDHYGAVDNFRVTNNNDDDNDNESNLTVAYDGSVYDLVFEDFWMEAYDFDWDEGYTGEDHGWIEGHVFDQDGNPIQDAVIEGWNEETAFSTYTDEDGYFGMEIMAGNYELEAHADGYSTEYDYVEVYPEETTYVEFYLHWEEDMTMVSGYVSDNEGNPISFALVDASYLYDEWESEGSFTDENGYYELHLEEGDYRISAGAEGYWVDAYDSVYVGMGDSLWLDFNLSAVEQFDGGWSGNVNLVGNHEPEMIFLGILSEDYHVIRVLSEPGFEEVELVNGTYHLVAGADGYDDVFMPFAIQIENNTVTIDINLFEEGLQLPPSIVWLGDVPNDQGRQMRMVWHAGVPGDWQYFPFYSIWRQVGDGPVNLWDYIETVPWHGTDELYSAVVPTLGDSTAHGIWWSTFRVTAHTENPMVFFDSYPETGYSIDNLHPYPPGGVQAFHQDDGILLTWDSPVDEDFGYHRVYRHDLNSEDPAIDFTTADTFLVDNVTGGNYEYWITAVDLNGNESDASNVVTVTLDIDDGFAIPTDFVLKQNYPNPFNPSTQIQFGLPSDANIEIVIFDLMGRRVRSLVKGQVPAGYHSALWNATNDLGAPVSAGVYIYTIVTPEYRDVKKMILLK